MTTVIGGIDGRVRRVQRSGDAGTTLTELIIAMGIFTLLLMVFMGAVVSMSQTTVRTQVTSDTTSQMRTTFQRFDKEVRYASEINAPGIVAGDAYVEYLIPANTATGVAQCVQWRLRADENELQVRTWPPDDLEAVTGWATTVTDVRNDLTESAQNPFTVHAAGTSDTKVFLRQRLDLFLDAGLGEEGDGRGGQLDVTFVALNSSVYSETNASTDQVCLGEEVGRP